MKRTLSGVILAGAHDPSFSYSFSLSDPALYLISLPYHTTAIDGVSLGNQIPNAVQVIRVVPRDPGLGGGFTTESWFGSFGTNFPIHVLKAYFVSVSAPTTWTPPHY